MYIYIHVYIYMCKCPFWTAWVEGPVHENSWPGSVPAHISTIISIWFCIGIYLYMPGLHWISHIYIYLLYLYMYM